jgi:hypothetical protein
MIPAVVPLFLQETMVIRYVANVVPALDSSSLDCVYGFG